MNIINVHNHFFKSHYFIFITSSSYFICDYYFIFQVLQTGQEITELDQSGFATQSATVFAGNVGPFIIQATRTDIRLLKGGMLGILQ